jgi:hypothetical protein
MEANPRLRPGVDHAQETGQTLYSHPANRHTLRKLQKLILFFDFFIDYMY